MTFTMWSFGHIVFILSPFTITYLLHLITRKLNHEQKRKVGIYLSLVAVGILVARNVDFFLHRGRVFDYELVPLQVCHFANLVLLYSFMRRSKVGFSLAFCLNLIAAFLSIIFADGLANYGNILDVRPMAYIIGHVLIVVITAWAFFNDFVFVKFRTFVYTVIVVEIMVILSVIINNLFYLINGEYANYFYTLFPEKGTPLEWWYNIFPTYQFGDFILNIFYVLGLMVLFPLVAYIMYIIAKLFNKAE